MHAVIILVVTLLVVACNIRSDSDSNQPPDPQILLQLHAEPDLVAGGAIVDEDNREVVLRGSI